MKVKIHLLRTYILMLFFDLLCAPFGNYRANRKESKTIYKLVKEMTKPK